MHDASSALAAKKQYPLVVAPELNQGGLQLPLSVGVAELACILKMHPDHVYRLLKTDPGRLPPPAPRTKPKQRLVWILIDVLAWMRRGQHQPDTAIQDRSHLGRAQPSSKKIGRPSKAEQVRRQSQGAAHG